MAASNHSVSCLQYILVANDYYVVLQAWYLRAPSSIPCSLGMSTPP